MKKCVTLITFLIMISLILTACKSYDEPSTPVQMLDIISLKNYLPELEDAAKDWNKDAYFVGAEIPIYDQPDKNELWLIRATFQSPAYDNLSLSVEMGLDKKINTHVIGHTVPIIRIDQINIQDWNIDSPEAVTQFESTHKIIGSLKRGDNAFLFLERRIINAQSHIVWRLTMINGGTHLYIDANSGKELLITE